MELLMSILIGLIFAAAVYLILSKSLLRIIIGTAVLSHGVNLLVLTMGGLKKVACQFLVHRERERIMIPFHKHLF